jgi:ABC-type multidrug transport system fused ATPase/permease subunit
MKGRTTLLVSHRLQLVEQADEILVIGGGRILESGSSAELILAGGVYSRLHSLAAASGVLFADERAGQLLESPRK